MLSMISNRVISKWTTGWTSSKEKILCWRVVVAEPPGPRSPVDPQDYLPYYLVICTFWQCLWFSDFQKGPKFKRIQNSWFNKQVLNKEYRKKINKQVLFNVPFSFGTGGWVLGPSTWRASVPPLGHIPPLSSSNFLFGDGRILLFQSLQ